jgi:hypothetical protein
MEDAPFSNRILVVQSDLFRDVADIATRGSFSAVSSSKSEWTEKSSRGVIHQPMMDSRLPPYKQ